MSPTAIQSDQRSVMLREKGMVFWPKHLTAQRFKDDPPFWKCACGFMQFQIASIRRQDGRVLARVILRKTERVDGYGLQNITANR